MATPKSIVRRRIFLSVDDLGMEDRKSRSVCSRVLDLAPPLANVSFKDV